MTTLFHIFMGLLALISFPLNKMASDCFTNKGSSLVRLAEDNLENSVKHRLAYCCSQITPLDKTTGVLSLAANRSL
ncbi:MAG: hypothetical protein CBB75_15470 [bacterium TMED15]|nr:MAG: hypothetical protein CBB75_15470 [bacterium TMED15]